MKRFVSPLILAIIVSCGSNPTDAPEVINEKYEPTDAELYAACADLQGVGQFIIGKTTFKQVLADKDFRKVATSSYDRQSNFYNGHWGVDFWKSKNEGSIYPDNDKAKWMEKKTGSAIKQLHTGAVDGFSIGELKFYPFDMAFLNDTLVAVYFYPDSKIEKDVIEHYKEKYGNGRGSFYSSDYRKTHSDSKLTVIRTVDEKHSWENESVALVYEGHEFFHMEPDKAPIGNKKKSMMVYSKKRYPVFEEMLLGYAAEFDKKAQSDKKNSLSSL